MTHEEDIFVPRWFLEIIEDTLRIQYNINEPDMKETGESCQDRNIKQCLNGTRKLLSGEELTGMERQEKLQPSLPEGLDEAAREYSKTTFHKPLSDNPDEEYIVYDPDKFAGFKAGAAYDRAKLLKNAVEGRVAERIQGKLYARVPIPETMGFEFYDKVKFIIVKEEEK